MQGKIKDLEKKKYVNLSSQKPKNLPRFSKQDSNDKVLFMVRAAPCFCVCDS